EPRLTSFTSRVNNYVSMTITMNKRSANVRLSRFARSLLEEWRRLELPESDARVVVAVSGGADSTALLLGLDELITHEKLRLSLTVAHLDHRLRDDSSKDARWVSRLGKELGYNVVVGRVNLKARKSRENLE